MDIKTLLNRAKTRIRYWLISDLWIKKLVPAKIRHLFSVKVIDALETHMDVPAPYIPGRYRRGLTCTVFQGGERAGSGRENVCPSAGGKQHSPYRC